MAFLIVLFFHMRLLTSHLHLWDPASRPLIDALTRGCFTGVTLFFVLSGFLLFLPYVNALLFDKPWPEAKIFYMRRILRIFPAYFFTLFLLIMLQAPYLLNPHNWRDLFSFLTLTMEFSTTQPVDGPLWTLAIECQYYLFLPFIALAIYGLTRLVRAKGRLWVVSGCLFALIAWGLATRYVAGHPSMNFLLPHTILNNILGVVYGEKGKFLEDFAVGMLIAVIYVFLTNTSERERYLRKMQKLSPWFGILSVLLFLYASMRYYSVTGGYSWPIAPHLFQIFPWASDLEIDFALSYGFCIVAVLFNRPGGLLRRVFEWDPLRWLGLISFSLYIWHIPFLNAFQQNVGPSLHHMNRYLAILVAWVVILIIVVPFCFLVYIMIEKPAMNLSNRLRQQMTQKRQAKAERLAHIPEAFSQAKPDQQELQTAN